MVRTPGGATVPLLLGGLRAACAGVGRGVERLRGRTLLDLDGRVVLVTGAARGLGTDIARATHARGATVALVGRRLEPLQELADELGERAAAFEADVGDLAALERAAAGTAELFGGIDVVVANAGIAPPSDTVRTSIPSSSSEQSTSTCSASGARSAPLCRS